MVRSALVSHAETSICTGVAHLGTDLAMFMGMLGAFLGGFPADLCTVLTDQAGELAFALEEIDRQLAEFGAIRIQSDTALHHFGIVFGLAGLCTGFTGEQCFLAGIDTWLV